jgi:hypothetical protein
LWDEIITWPGTDVKCIALMFKCLLISEGKVEMLGKESIHAIVLGLFSVAIMSEDIHEKFRFKRVSYFEKKNVILP